MPFRNVWIILVAAVTSFVCYRKAQQDEYAAELARAMNVIKSEYLDADRITTQQLFEGAMDGMVARLDIHSSFISRADLQRFEEGLDQQFAGIGIHVDLDPETQRLTVRYPLVGQPGYEAGLRIGDTILAIDGKSTEGMSLTEAVNLMRGKVGEVVVLSVRHLGEEKPVRIPIKREIITIDSVLGDARTADGKGWNYFLEEDPRIGYIRMQTFGEQTTEELQTALQFRKPVKGLILDLRWNSGGLLPSAVEVCDLFIDDSWGDGLIVTTRGKDRKIKREYRASEQVAIDKKLPIVVLVNQDSASASEIVAACLKDRGRAIVVGERTYGKGTVQNIIHMEGGHSALKITTASYWRPNGKDINRRAKDVPYDPDDEKDWGVRPTAGFEIPLTEMEEAEIIRRRRMRDYDQDEKESPAENQAEKKGDGSNGTDAESNAGDSGAIQHKPVVDTQLRRAIEYLQQQFRTAELPGERVLSKVAG